MRRLLPSSCVFLLASLVGLSACADDEETEGSAGCDQYDSDVTELDGSLDSREDCGRWSLSVGEHAYVNVEISEPEAPCTGTATGSMEILYDPTYSNMSNDTPKWTYDLQAMEAGEGQLVVTCVDGSTWGGIFEVSD